MRQLKIGVIGAGSISHAHLGAYQASEHAHLQAICDMNEERAREQAKTYDIADVYTDYHELLASPNVEAVSICTWNNSHAEIAIAALEAGKDVLVEKPLCKTMEEAYAVQEAVKRTGRKLQVGFVRRFGGNTDLAKTFIDAGDLGDIYYAKTSVLRRLGNPGGWFADIERSGGGPVIDVGVHVIDLCWYLMGRPKVTSISANTYKKLGNRPNIKNLEFYKAADYDASKNDVEDLANALIRFENGASLAVDCSFTLHKRKDELSATIFGDKGGAEIEPELYLVGEKHHTILNIEPQVDERTFSFEKGFQAQIEGFIQYCFGEGENRSPVEDGVEVMKMLTGIYESAKQQKEIVF
ncbi:Gfo/Idh/MocA family oxidoreductase [Bacillaceae bacterium SIJ1]|uniref:Gfo/Idh/MocA family protein n=1 Tax=Litoribacterium kuwaitense TaxID=1398745 RepID=UPI0013EDD51E|nr:Gfo/Idh/MocA family oxidoreductase [Litoribacterium kuwaitense]NGP44678.1 Gfo/Idh/MocA family oxidoreductase [Litoribacterium kuwaitense]